MISTAISFVNRLSTIYLVIQLAISWEPKMSTERLKATREINPLLPSKGDQISVEEMQALDIATAAAAAAAAQIMPSLYFAKEMGEISEKTNGLRDDNIKLREKIEALKRENFALKGKIDAMESQNLKQGETIRILKSSQSRLQEELEDVKKAKDRLQIEFNKENQILAVKLDAMVKEFKAVENENKELKRRLEELTYSNNSLKQTVDSIKEENQSIKEENQSIREENQRLKDDMGNLKTDHKKIREKLECKETRLALGQVAWMLEAEIWKAVLPGHKMGLTGILKSMERWLKKNSSSADGKAAQKRWDELKSKLNWDEDDHRGALSCLKNLRRVDAHPQNVDLEEARKQLKEGNYVADIEKNSCEEIINMVTIAKTLNN